ncbi:MAG TPA: hypothetical protein VG478_00150 [Acidimicrobiales bacterium]|jgi:hypothetical protein|nr:hypothetical protein [Acidimicrobiales bacterium]
MPAMTAEIDVAPSRSMVATPLTRTERRRVTAVWILLFCSSLSWSIDQPAYVVPIPTRAEQVGTGLALLAAGYLAYRSNPRLRLQGAWPAVIYAVVPVVALCAPLAGVAGLGSMFRAGRFLAALGVLALLAPTWRRDAWVLANAHARVLRLMIGIALAWFVVGKGVNLEGRLIAQVPALYAPQVGQFAAVLIGVTILQALSGAPRLPRGGLWIALGIIALLLSKTRTPLVAGAVALGLAALSLCLTHARARRVLAGLLIAGPLLYVALAPFVRSFLRRDQTEDVLSTLTGRTTAWAKVHAFPRTGFQELFGVGYADKSIDGVPIDNGYIATYHEIGKIGLLAVIVVLGVLAVRAFVHTASARRAVAVFLVIFVAIASYTETGIGDMSAYVMHLVLAGAMVTSVADRHPPDRAGPRDRAWSTP